MTDSNEFPEGFFDHLSPDDFVRESSARQVAVLDDIPFDDFVERSLESLRFAYYAADGNPNPVAILVGPDGRRIFSPDDDETLGQYLDRLGREARKHKSTRLFTAWLTEGGTYEGEDQHDIGSQDGLALVGEENMKIVLYWYAQNKRKPKQIRHGLITIEAGDLGDCVEADGDHAAPVYRQILGA